MAKLVLGLGTSHSPQVSTEIGTWPLHAERDRRRQDLVGPRGVPASFAALEQGATAVSASQLSEPAWQEMYKRCQEAIAHLADSLERVDPDVVVIVGDDQDELFLADGIPMFSVFWGQSLRDIPPTSEEMERLRPGMKEAMWAWHADEPEDHVVWSEFGRHITESLAADSFDIAQFTMQPEGRGLGHAFVFVRRRLMLKRSRPIVPIFVNTFFPPNQPTASRCYRFGQALARAISSWEVDARVAVVASGGLSHFVIDEELDRAVLESMRRRDVDALSGLDQVRLQSGTSEIRNWLVVAGAVESLEMRLVDYVPTYRSKAGTGVGMAFAEWLPFEVRPDEGLIS